LGKVAYDEATDEFFEEIWDVIESAIFHGYPTIEGLTNEIWNELNAF